MRRRALLAASGAMWEDENLPPESTTFEFPLYLNTRIVEKTSDYLYRSRDADDISKQLLQFWGDNYSGSGAGGDSTEGWPRDFFKDYPVFIDGYQVESISRFSTNIAENIKTSRNYGDYTEVSMNLDEFELYVDGWN